MQLQVKHLDHKSIKTAVKNYEIIKKNQYFSYIRQLFYTSTISQKTKSFLFKNQHKLTDDDRYAIVKNYILANHERALAKQFAQMDALVNDPEIKAVYGKKNRW